MTWDAGYRSVEDVLAAIRAAGRSVAAGGPAGGGGAAASVAATEMVAATDTVAGADLPSEDVARVAGWALTALSTVGAGPDAPLPLDPPPRRVRIGDALGDGCDAVAEPEAVEAAFGSVAAVMPVGPYEAVRRRGEDARAGDVLVRAGSVLTGLRRAALAAGVSAVAGLGEVVAGNAAGGGLVRGSDLAPPDPAVLAAARDLLGGAGVRVVVSADPMADARALAAAGATVAAARIAMRPGSETALVIAAGEPVLVVPALLDAVAAVRIGLLDALGETGQEEAPGALTGRVTSQVGMTDLVLVARAGEDWTPLATGTWPLRAVLTADGCLVLPPSSEGLAAGTTVRPRSLEGETW
ncbi:hypothetical protein [Mongoliimonas terrestris]|uniref:hypothetical protein n=1 Tax=Mongoliimonas terrestris TaxID=1709001 RepID=UPI0009495F45|nr:hypothetical protein [Mongoliimonas terrestris]